MVLTWIRNFMPLNSLPMASRVTKESGAPAISSSVAITGRMAACGQTKEHWLHWIQFSGIHSGTLMATPRFSYWAVATGKSPSGSKADTGSVSPFWAKMGRITFFTKSGTSFSAVHSHTASAQEAGYLISNRFSVA